MLEHPAEVQSRHDVGCREGAAGVAASGLGDHLDDVTSHLRGSGFDGLDVGHDAPIAQSGRYCPALLPPKIDSRALP